MIQLTKMVEGIRVYCTKCQRAVTPILKVQNDPDSNETQRIDCECPGCGELLKVFR